MRFEIVRLDAEEPKLYRLVYEFEFTTELGLRSPKLKLVRYERQSRPTPRHGWRFEGYYNRLDSRASTLTVEQVPLPDDILAEARAYIKGIVDTTPLT